MKSKNRNTNRKQGMAWENARLNMLGTKKIQISNKEGREGRERVH